MNSTHFNIAFFIAIGLRQRLRLCEIELASQVLLIQTMQQEIMTVEKLLLVTSFRKGITVWLEVTTPIICFSFINISRVYGSRRRTQRAIVVKGSD